MQWLKQTWDAIEENLRWADVVDVCLVAIFIYFVLRWLSARSSRGILAGALIVGACYVLTDWLDLYLTRILFQTGFIFLLLSIVVVLQGDIRRGFEKLATLRLPGRKVADDPDLQVIRDLLATVSQLSDDRIGALIVFPGREPVARFTRGGIQVDGHVSPALLHSIFSPQSPGHDGAIIIRDGRIELIGLHLPLSSNLEAIGPGGTRHAAALGLAERCDVLVLVVSEERGTISIATQGELRSISIEELEEVLIRHERSRSSASMRSPSQRKIGHDMMLKFGSLAVAIVLWAVFAFQVDSVQRAYVTPIEIRNLPSQLVMRKPPEARATLLLSGTERALRDVDAEALVVSFDLSEARAGATFHLRTSEGIKNLPAELRVIDVDPPILRLDIETRPAPATADPVGS